MMTGKETVCRSCLHAYPCPKTYAYTHPRGYSGCGKAWNLSAIIPSVSTNSKKQTGKNHELRCRRHSTNDGQRQVFLTCAAEPTATRKWGAAGPNGPPPLEIVTLHSYFTGITCDGEASDGWNTFSWCYCRHAIPSSRSEATDGSVNVPRGPSGRDRSSSCRSGETGEYNRRRGRERVHHMDLRDPRTSGNNRIERARPKFVKLITRLKGPPHPVLVSSSSQIARAPSTRHRKRN